MAGLRAAFMKSMDAAGIADRATASGNSGGATAAWTELQNAVPMAIAARSCKARSSSAPPSSTGHYTICRRKSAARS